MKTIDKDTFERAVQFACKMHFGVVDLVGDPYILHPLRVGTQGAKNTLLHGVIGVLHDVVEDTDTTLADIFDLFGLAVGLGVDALTRRDPETYFDYIRRVKLNVVARDVKILDIQDNMRAGTSEGMVARYEKALMMLSGFTE